MGPVVSGLKVGQDAAGGRDSDASADDNGGGEVVEPLSRSTKGSVDADLDLRHTEFSRQVAKLSCPVAICLDVQTHFLSAADGHSERVPLKLAQRWDMEEDILPSAVFPVPLARDGGLGLDCFAVQNLESRGYPVQANADSGESLDQNQQGRKGEPVSKHGPLG